MALVIRPSTKKKLLERHNVSEKEILEYFLNRDREALDDTREENKTDPPTKWIIAETNHLRELKLVFIVKDGNTILKTAYEPNQEEVWIYNRHAQFL